MVTARADVAWKRWTLAFLVIWIGSSFPVQAQVQQASRSLVPKFLNQTLDPLPNNKEAYLVVTAGGASTDILLVANPSVPPQKLIQALQSAVAGTPLQSQPMEWSSPTPLTQWTAVHTARRQGHIGAWQATNTIPIGAFCDGLHHAGFIPHPALHIPNSVFCAPLPAPFADFSGYSWYDLETMPSRDFLEVRSTVSPADFIPLLLLFLLIPMVGLAGQAIALRWARNRERTRENRRRFDLISSLPVMLCLIGWMISLMSSGSRSQWQAIGDVWFGNAGGGSDPSMIEFALVLMTACLVVWNGQRTSVRLYGPEGTIPVTAMSPQERTLRERETLWLAASPLVLCGIAIALIMGGRSWLPSSLPPATFRLLPLLVILPLGFYFQKKLKAFTTLLPDPTLTDNLRQMAAAPGLPPPEVVVEQSARAKSYAFLGNAAGGRVVVSQKLCELASPDQMTFLLVSQSMLGRTRDWSKISSLVIGLALLGIVLGTKPLAALGHNAYFLMVMPLMLILVIAMFVSIAVTSRRNIQRALTADQAALRLTDNPNAALQALAILRQNAIPPSSSSARQSQVRLQLERRIAALNSDSPSVNAKR